MADATAAVNTKRRIASCFDFVAEYACVTGTTIYKGTGVGINNAGLLLPANNAASVRTVGVANATVIAAAAGTLLKVECGIFIFASSGLTIADRLLPCYWADNQTVNGTNTNKFAGTVYDVDALGAHVIFQLPTVADAT